METPSEWVILKIPNNYYKVFCSLGGDTWKINSGIKEIKQDDNFYFFTGFSGSCYKCNKKDYGIKNSYCMHILDIILKNNINDIELLSDVDNWEDIILK